MSNKALPLDLLIDITSAGVKDTFTIGKLNTIIIEPYNESLPNDTFIRVSNLQQAQSFFGFNSNVAKFSSGYFGFISKAATKCDYLFIYNWNKNDLPAVYKGGRTEGLGKIKQVGGFDIEISGVRVTLSGIDLRGADSFVEVANILQNAIQGASGQEQNANFKNALVLFSVDTSGFIIKSGIAGLGEKIAIYPPTQSTEPDADVIIDLTELLGFSINKGASVLEGKKGVATFAEALHEISENNGNYYLITPNFEFENVADDLKAFGEFLNASNDRFAGVYSWKNPLLEVLGSKATDAYEGFNGLIIDNKRQEFQNALICGIISAMDLSKNDGNYNVAFNDATTFQINALADRIKYEAMTENKANAPCKFGVLGQDDTIYMDGTILGSKTSSINVYVCNSFLKFNQQIQLYNMFKSQKLIGVRGSKSQSIVYAYLDSVFQKAVNAGIIAQGVQLTTTEQQSIISTFSALVDDINIVLEKLETSGYFYIISDVNVTTREITITESYTANTPAKKIIINNYILGA